MRRAVLSTKFAQPNRFFVIFHVVNFTLLAIVALLNMILKLTKVLEYGSDADAIYDAVQYTIVSYTDAFLLYLIVRFLR